MPQEIRVLLVDDETAFLQAITKVLARRGIALQTAQSGSQALGILSHQQFDVIVLDVRMPGMDGIAVFEEVRRADALTPVIFLSGQADVGRVNEVLKSGAANYLLKPCDVDELVAAIENAFERKKIGLEVVKETEKQRHRR